jgi:zinc/manganese transport system substrate-binding protein
VLGSAAAVGAVLLAACGASTGSASSKPRGACPTRPVPVVVSVDQWGDIVSRLAGDCGDVTTIFKSSSADPHDYEPAPADIERFSGARLVVVNGLDYDPWATKAIDALDSKPVVVNGGKVVGRQAGDNPHIWYGPHYVEQVADAVTAALTRLEPRDSRYFAAQRSSWERSMQPYRDAIARLVPLAQGKTYGATEGIFDDMAQALGLRDRTPSGFRHAVANETDPSPGDIHDFEQALAHHEMSVLVFNTQTEGAIPQQIRSNAQRAHVPVVDVTESVPPKFATFEAWQVDQLHRLAGALSR